MALHVGSNTPHPKQPSGNGQDPNAAVAAAWPPGRNPHRWRWWLGAAVLHAGLLALAWHARPWRDRATPPAPVVVPLRWLAAPGTARGHSAPAQPPQAAHNSRPRTDPTAEPPVRPPARPLAEPAQRETTAIRAAALPDPPDPTPGGATPMSPPLAGPTPAAASAPPPLNLNLPQRAGGDPTRPPRPPSLLSEMLNDPRANTPKATVESRIAAVLGNGRWQVEDLGEGAKRYRRGAECYVVKPSRSGLLNPFNASMYTPPPLVGSC